MQLFICLWCHVAAAFSCSIGRIQKATKGTSVYIPHAVVDTCCAIEGVHDLTLSYSAGMVRTTGP